MTIHDRAALAPTPAGEVALDCVAAGVDAAHPRRVVADAVSVDGEVLLVDGARYDLEGVEHLVVLGGGKAAGHVAAALESVLGDRIDGGVVVTDDPTETETIAVRRGDHPVPSERNVAATREVLDAASDADERTLVLAVIAGGGSALLAAPAVPLAALQATTEALVESGASIDEINAVRTHLSSVKGGRLARAAAPARVVSLVFSDVVGDDLDVIASGPTVPATTTFADALAVLDRHDLAVPTAVDEHLRRGARDEAPETPDRGAGGSGADGEPAAHVLAGARTAVDAAAAAAAERGYDPLILSTRFEGEARELGGVHAAVAAECVDTGRPVEPPAVLLSGGEATVTVRGDGTGGPNQECALAAALAADSSGEWAFASVDTDGRDGATDAAGALVDGDTVDDRDAARAALDDNDAYPYLDERNALVRTGRTGTNVNDLRAFVVE